MPREITADQGLRKVTQFSNSNLYGSEGIENA